MQMHGRINIIVLAASLWTAAPLRAQQPLSVADYAEIQRLNAYWIHGSDTGDANIRMRAFAPGGVLRQPAGFGGCEGSTKDCETMERPKDVALANAPVIPQRP